MEPGTKFCPDHFDLRFPAFAQECTVCNKPLKTKEVELEFLEPPFAWPKKVDVVIEAPSGPTMQDTDIFIGKVEPKKTETLKATLKEFHETITARVDDKAKAKKQQQRDQLIKDLPKFAWPLKTKEGKK